MKIVILERKIQGKIHRTILHEDVFLHIDIIDKLYNRIVRRNIMVDIDALIDMVKAQR